ncbi:peptidase inhibitor I9 [Thiocapsa rosea]|uniref:Peptidase inhibitor I9 n=2 Tax=Thiocapsa rosea TaxID=69360 RepID=A0A495V9I2_9GAMM|nr:peptidase inhibitor I9 [Thiocapsa rosea]
MAVLLAVGTLPGTLWAAQDAPTRSSPVLEQASQTAARPGHDAIPGHYIVVFEDAAFSASARARGRLANEVERIGRSLAQGYGAAVESRWSHALQGMSVRMSAQAAAALAKDPRVALVEQDTRFFAASVQSPVVWGLDRIDQRDLPLDNTYRYSNGAESVTAYVLDSGIRVSHAEFAGRAVWGINVVGDGIDTDCEGHGTHVAATLGGATYGVAKQVGLVAVKVLDCGGGGSASGIISGIEWMIAHAQRPAVANLSVVGPNTASVNLAVAHAVDAGITVVVAAGNDNGDACFRSPASAPDAITVGSTTNLDLRSSFSNWGACLDLFAPGSAILSAYIGSDSATRTLNGTSMAAPHVAGAAAHYLQTDPGATPATVATRLLENATAGRVGDPGSGSANRLLFTAFSTDREPSLSVNRLGLGRVSSLPAGIDCGAACGAAFERGSVVDLTATAGVGFTFSGWSGACAGTGSCRLTMDGDRTATATFVDPYGSTEVFPPGGVWPDGWTGSPDSDADWTLATYPVAEGHVSLRSGPVAHGGRSSIEVTRAFTQGRVSFDWTVSSEADRDGVSFFVDGVLVGRLSGCANWSASCWRSVNHQLPAGTHTLTWSYEKDGSVSGGLDAAWLDNVVLPPVVAPAPVRLEVTKTGGGRVISAPNGIDCGTRCSADFGSDSEVLLTAAPDPGYAFGGWSGSCAGSAATCRLTMSTARSVGASFNRLAGATFAGLYSPAAGAFYLRGAHSGGAADIAFGFGPQSSAWIPLAGDWDGDGRTTVGLYNRAAGSFHLRNMHAGGSSDVVFGFGPRSSTWTPLAGDWNGDGRTTVGLYNAVTGTFFLRNALAGGAADLTFRFGPQVSTWVPLAGDWNGDGRTTVGLYNPRTGTFHLRNAHAGGAADLTFGFGPPSSTWTPLAGDWNGDGRTTVGLYNRASGTFYFRNSHNGGAADITFGFGPRPSSWTALTGTWFLFSDTGK